MAQLQFKGKTFVQNHHLLVKYHELVPVKAKSSRSDVLVAPEHKGRGKYDVPVASEHKISLHDNLIIHGDNLKALKALLPLFARKIKCVCIDPPYNTGNEGWAYNDNVNSPMMQDWLGKIVDREDLTRHDKWLCMMMPRLKLIRELMTDDGVIFVFIDDNEVHHLRMLMDEVFGEDNWVGSIARQTRVSPDSDEKFITATHDQLLCYVRNAEACDAFRLERTSEQDSRYENPDSDPRGAWMSSDLTRREYREHDYYEITLPSGRKVKPAQGRSWGVPKTTFDRLVVDNRIWFGPDGNAMPRRKRFLSEIRGGVVPVSWWEAKKGTSNEAGRREVNDLFAETPNTFFSPKPSVLVQNLIQLVTDKDSIILDSFAGSGTTAHAVLAQNAADGGNRRFILIECEDYADKITAERVRRVIARQVEATSSPLRGKGTVEATSSSLKNRSGGDAAFTTATISGEDAASTGVRPTFSFFELGKAVELESILDGDNLPTYEDLARYVFYTATGEEFDSGAIDRKCHFIGESRNYQVFLFYEPDVAKLKNLALTLDMAKALPKLKEGKRRLVFAPTKYLDQDHLDQYRIDFAQLPFEIYELTR